MGNLTIRNLDDRVIEQLKVQAYVLTQQADRRACVADFRDRTRRIARMPAGTPQTDATDLLREDRTR